MSKKVKGAASVLAMVCCTLMATAEIVETDLYDAGSRL